MMPLSIPESVLHSALDHIIFTIGRDSKIAR